MLVYKWKVKKKAQWLWRLIWPSLELDLVQLTIWTLTLWLLFQLNHHIWKKVKVLVTVSENSSGEHECSVCLLLFVPILLLLNPAGMLWLFWPKDYHYGSLLPYVLQRGQTCFSGAQWARLKEELLKLLLSFKHQAYDFTFRRRLTFRSELSMMCIYSATIKDYVRILIYYKQKPTVDFQNSCVTRMWDFGVFWNGQQTLTSCLAALISTNDCFSFLSVR